MLADAAGLVIVAALTLYGVTGGADYGGGVWDLLARGRRAGAQRELIAHAIAPIWEANHVWLILAVVALFTAFPAAFARIAIALHVPLLLVLLGVVARGAAFSFRAYGQPEAAASAGAPAAGGAPGRVFAVASLVTPLVLGATLGAIAAGRARLPAAGIDYLTGWIGLFPLSVGVFALALFAFLAAVYLCHDAAVAGAADLVEDFRRRALGSGVVVAAVAAEVLWAAGREAPALLHDLTRTAWSWALHGATAAAALGALAALWRRRYQAARWCAATQVTFILWGWAAAQYPYIVMPDLTLAAAAAPAATLRLFLGAIAAGTVLLLPSFVYLFRVFGKLPAAPAPAPPTASGPPPVAPGRPRG
jgi:cytochrome d ubiquinol oxidase subunit II